MRTRFKFKDESGVILMASTMGVFIILSLFAFYLARFSVIESRTGGYYTQDIKVRNLAMAGIEQGLHSYKSSRNTSDIDGSFNNGTYSVRFDSQNDESGGPLSKSHYLTLKSTGKIDDVERNVRFLVSSLPEAFCFSFYGNNLGAQTFAEPNGSINGDMFFNGSVQSNSGASNGTTYIGTGSGGTLLSSPPIFPDIDDTNYEALLSSAQSASPDYQNYALDFNNNDYVRIESSSDINSGIHSQHTVEAWFRTNNKNSNTKQIIYEQGGGTRGLNIYIQSGRLYVGGWNRRSNESNWSGSWKYVTSIESNQWHHVALTLNGGSAVTNNALKLYLDGALVISEPGSRLWGHNPANIGRTISGSRYHNGTGNGFTFNGKIDEVRIWNVARSQSEINAMKDTVLNGDEDYLTAYYNFQENTGGRANDTQTQSNNDGTISGATWTTGPPLSKMNNSSFANRTINLSSYSERKLLVNSDITISNSTINGPGYIVANGNITINSNSVINGDIYVICNGDLNVTNSQLGTSLSAAVITYSKGNAEYENSTVYGLIVSKGNALELDGTAHYGAILNHGSSFTLAGNSDIIGSVVSKFSVDLQSNSASITRGNMPEFTGKDIGLNPFVLPGSYLEF
tara:strand:- start:3390 stop:5267 length:1878 start_codon:yes stop_codon:yes gene_type:complete